MDERRELTTAQAHEEWLASLHQRGIELSPDEQELLGTNNPLGDLLAQTIEVQARYVAHARERGDEIKIGVDGLNANTQQLTSSYRELLEKAQEPSFLATEGAVEELANQAQAITSTNKQVLILQEEANNIGTNLSNAFPAIRSLIVDIAKLDPRFVLTESKVTEPDLSGYEALIETAHQLIPSVVSEDTQPRVIVEKPAEKIEPKQPNTSKNNLFSSWEDVFGEKYTEYKSEDHNFLQLYRNAVKRIVDAYPEMFEDCGNLNTRGNFDWLKALEPVLELSVAELNSAVDYNDPRTIPTTARILAIAKRFMDDEGKYTHHEELLDLAKEVRAKGTEDETILIDLFKSPEELKKEKEGQAGLVYQAQPDWPTGKKRDREEERVQEIERVTNSVVSIIGKVNDQQTAKCRFGFPQKTMNRPQIAKLVRAEGSVIKSAFIEKMTELGLITPHGEPGSNGIPTYTESDIVQLYVLRATSPRGRNKRLDYYIKLVGDVYPEARKRYEESLQEQNSD